MGFNPFLTAFFLAGECHSPIAFTPAGENVQVLFPAPISKYKRLGLFPARKHQRRKEFKGFLFPYTVLTAKVAKEKYSVNLNMFVPRIDSCVYLLSLPHTIMPN